MATQRRKPAPKFASYAEWIRQARDTHEVVEQRRSSCGASLTQSRLAESFGDPATPDLKVFLVLAGDAPPTVGDVGFGKFSCHVQPGRFAVAGADVATDFVGSGPYELLALSLPWSALRADLESLLDTEAGHLGPRIHKSNPDDALVGRTLRRMWSAIPAAAPIDDRLLFDGLTNVLVNRLLELGGVELRRPKRSQRLSPSRLAGVLEYVESTLAMRLSLDELAAVAGCSRFHFSRLFRNAVGVSPVAYVTARRLDAVKNAMARDPDIPLRQIASEFGYSDQTYLVRQFRQKYGEPPKRWLRGR